MHSKLEEERVEFEAKLQVINEIKLEKKKQEEEEARMKEEEYRKHAFLQKQKAEAFKQEKEMEAEELYQKHLAEQQALQFEKDQRFNENAERVAKNTEEGVQKMLNRMDHAELKKNAPKMKQQRLDNAVKSYKHRPNPSANPDRIIKRTAAMELREGVEMDKADKVNLFKNNGWTVDGLMKDMRYKVSAALSDAGLQNTEYGKSVMKGMQTNLAARRDMTGTHF